MNLEGFKTAVDSLSQYHKITNEKLAGESEIGFNEDLVKKLYVDLLPENGILEFVKTKKTTFLVGRRGTGKSTVFARAQQSIREEKKYLSVYVNAKTVYKNTEAKNLTIESNLPSVFSNDEMFRISMIESTIKSMKESLFEELKLEENDLFDHIAGKFRDTKLIKVFNEIDKLIEKPLHKSVTKTIIESKTDNKEMETFSELKASLSPDGISSKVGLKQGSTEIKAYENTIAKYFNIGNIVEKFLEVIKICKRRGIYIFFDDYSELNRVSRQLFMEAIIEPFYHIGADKLFIKISSYPYRYDPINLQVNKYDLKIIDLYEIYGKDYNITETEKKAIEYTEKIIVNRINIFCEGKFSQYFDTDKIDQNEYFKQLYYASNNIPRTMGGILNICYHRSIIHKKKITLSILDECIKKYYEEMTSTYFNKRKSSKMEDIEEKIDIFVQENLLNDIIDVSLKLSNELKGTSNSYFKEIDTVPTSHFTVSETISDYLEILEFNGFVNRINSIAAKSTEKSEYRNKKNVLYSLDLGLCKHKKIAYGRPVNKDTKYFQQRAFQYDDIINNSLSNNKKIKCKNCNSEFDIKELETIKKYGMTCSECKQTSCEIVFNDKLKSIAKVSMKNSSCSAEEIEVLHTLFKLKETDGVELVTARKISLQTDYNSQIIASKCKKLEEGGFVLRKKVDTLYRYSLTQRGIDYIMNSINIQ